MELGICSYSFHRLLEAGEQDIFRYITDCKTFGCTRLDPWNLHLAPGLQPTADVKAAGLAPGNEALPAADRAYLETVKAAAAEAGLPFGCVAVDSAHIYDADPTVRTANRANAYRWIEIAAFLGAAQMRIDAGGPEEMPDEAFVEIVAGYRDLVDRCRANGIELVMENHWGPGKHHANVIKIMEAVPGLGLLFDTHNWAPGTHETAWALTAKYARCAHIKTFTYDADGNETSNDLHKAIHILVASGFTGPWSVESVPREVDEYEGVRLTIALIRRALESAGVPA